MTSPRNRKSSGEEKSSGEKKSSASLVGIVGIFFALALLLAISSQGQLSNAMPMAVLGLQLLGITLLLVGLLQIMGFAKSRLRRSLVDHLPALTFVFVGLAMITSAVASVVAIALIWAVALFKDSSEAQPATPEIE